VDKQLFHIKISIIHVDCSWSGGRERDRDIRVTKLSQGRISYMLLKIYQIIVISYLIPQHPGPP